MALHEFWGELLSWIHLQGYSKGTGIAHLWHFLFEVNPVDSLYADRSHGQSPLVPKNWNQNLSVMPLYLTWRLAQSMAYVWQGS